MAWGSKQDRLNPDNQRIEEIMKLVYDKTHPSLAGHQVWIGDDVMIDGQVHTVKHFAKPTSPASSGKVTVTAKGFEQEFYVGIIRAEWIEREDRADPKAGSFLVTAIYKKGPPLHFLIPNEMLHSEAVERMSVFGQLSSIDYPDSSIDPAIFGRVTQL